MNKSKLSVSADELAQLVVSSMQDKKAIDISILNLKKIDKAITDYFVICTATSFTHLDSIAESVEAKLFDELGERPLHYEKVNNVEWILLDYFNVVIHIFSKEKREFYDLEGLWGDAETTKFENIG